VEIMIKDTKPWHLCGSGAFQKRDKVTQPKLKLDRRKLRAVRGGGLKPKSSMKSHGLSSQLGVLDHEANQLLVDLRGGASTTMMPQSMTTSALATVGPVGIDDDYSEEELAMIFQQQTAKIANAFNQPVEEPASFRRTPPFAVTASAGQNLTQQGGAGRQEEDSSASKAALANSAYSGSGTGGASIRPSSTVFLTGVGEEPPQSRGQRLDASATSGYAYSGGDGQSQPPTPGASALALAGGSMLPPIQGTGQPGSRGSSAGGVSRSDPLDMLLKDSGTRTKAMPDIGVREAMKALRAAAMSEYAVAA